MMSWKLVLIAELLLASCLVASPTPIRVYDPGMLQHSYNVREAGPSAPSTSLTSGPSAPAGSSQFDTYYHREPVKFPDPQPITAPSYPSYSPGKVIDDSHDYHTELKIHSPSIPSPPSTYLKTQAKYIAPQFTRTHPNSLPSHYNSHYDVSNGLSTKSNSQYDNYNGFNAEVQPVTYNKHNGKKTFSTNPEKEELNDGLVAFYNNPLVDSKSTIRFLKMYELHPAFKAAMTVDAFYDMSSLALPKGFGDVYHYGK